MHRDTKQVLINYNTYFHEFQVVFIFFINFFIFMRFTLLIINYFCAITMIHSFIIQTAMIDLVWK